MDGRTEGTPDDGVGMRGLRAIHELLLLLVRQSKPYHLTFLP